MVQVVKPSSLPGGRKRDLSLKGGATRTSLEGHRKQSASSVKERGQSTHRLCGANVERQYDFKEKRREKEFQDLIALLCMARCAVSRTPPYPGDFTGRA